MTNWKSLSKRIPKKFKVGRKTFKVIFINNVDYLGLSDWNKNRIYLNKKQSKKELVHTYIHEIIHIMSDEYELKISEKQVQGLEKTLRFWIESGNIFI